jgi:hypothetical protein
MNEACSLDTPDPRLPRQAQAVEILWLGGLAGLPTRIPVKGDSMFPLFRDEDRALIVPVDPEDVRSGDILLVRIHGQQILHRCRRVMKGPDGVVVCTQGDLGPPDPPVGGSDVVGRVIARERAGRRTLVTGAGFRAVRLTALWYPALLRLAWRALRAVGGGGHSRGHRP